MIQNLKELVKYIYTKQSSNLFSQLCFKGYPLSTLGENIKIEYTNDGCCPYTKTNKYAFISLYALPCFAPFIICGLMCYYRKNPEIQISHHFIQGTLCPNCRTGKIQYSVIADGECTTANQGTKTKELFICTNCNTVYPEYNLGKYIGPNPTFRRHQRRHDHDYDHA